MPFPRVCLSFWVVGEAESPEWKWLEFGIFIVNNQTNILKPHAVLSRSSFSASSHHVTFPMDVTHSILSPITASAGLHNPYHCLSQHEDSKWNRSAAAGVGSRQPLSSSSRGGTRVPQIAHGPAEGSGAESAAGRSLWVRVRVSTSEGLWLSAPQGMMGETPTGSVETGIL